MLTRSSLFCVLNTIYYSVSQLVGQNCWVCSPKVGCETVLRGSQIIYSQRNDISKKLNSKCFILKDFYFKRHARKLLSLLSQKKRTVLSEVILCWWRALFSTLGRRVVTLYNFTKVQKLQACSSTVQ